MAELWWKIRAAFWFMLMADVNVSHAWYCAKYTWNFYEDEMSGNLGDPYDAVLEDLSYWEL